MWDEHPAWQEANWRFLAGSLKVGFIIAGLFSLFFGTWEPLLSLSKILATMFAALLLGWIGPMWLLGKAINSFAKERAQKELKQARG